VTAPAEIPDTVTVDGAAVHDAVFLLELVEAFLAHSFDADALLGFYPYPTDTAKLAEWAGCTAAYLRRRLEGFPP
jgi:hypothetical protein